MTDTLTSDTPTASAAHPNSKTLAAVAYILTFITGLIIYFVAPKDDKYARWHAIQAIGLGVAALLVSIILSYVPFLGMLSILWSVLVLVAVIILAVKAYQGNSIRLPIVAEMADKNA